MTYALFELAQNHDIQISVRTEINDICSKHGNEITYDGLMEMPLLDRVIHGKSNCAENMHFMVIHVEVFLSFRSETMRMHPAVGTLHRVVDQDYTLPNGAVAPKGTYVIVPAVAFHNDPGKHEPHIPNAADRPAKY